MLRIEERNDENRLPTATQQASQGGEEDSAVVVVALHIPTFLQLPDLTSKVRIHS